MTIPHRSSIVVRIIFVLVSVLLVSCGTSDNGTLSDAEKGAGIAFQLKWPVAKIVGSVPVGVVTVRMSVSGPGMNTIEKDFPASAGTGSIDNVPVGANRTITFQGLDSGATVLYQAAVTAVELVSGQVYNTGPVTMAAVVATAPSGLTATAASSSQINLAWTDNSGNETGFNIERKTGATGVYSLVGTAAANSVSYSDSGLTQNTSYYYRVQATNAGGDSAYSNEAGTTTITAPPSAPTNLTATAVSSSQIDLAWTDNSVNETGFNIERKTGAAGVYALVGTASANAVSYSDSGLSKNTSYYYRVRATNAGGDSAFSNEANATPADGITVSVKAGDVSAKAGCFIATAAYGSYLDPHVKILRDFRDRVLLKSTMGSAFTAFYYQISPPIADFIRDHESLRFVTRLALTPVVLAVRYAPLAVGMFVLLISVLGNFVFRRRKSLP